jgi:hypothetical protein
LQPARPRGRTSAALVRPDGLGEAQLEALLFPPPPDVPSDQRPVPDWSAVHRDLRRPNVTLALLWEEYRAATTDGSGYSWFCDLYREWAGRLKPTLRQVHIAGERLVGLADKYIDNSIIYRIILANISILSIIDRLEVCHESHIYRFSAECRALSRRGAPDARGDY